MANAEPSAAPFGGDDKLLINSVNVCSRWIVHLATGFKHRQMVQKEWGVATVVSGLNSVRRGNRTAECRCTRTCVHAFVCPRVRQSVRSLIR